MEKESSTSWTRKEESKEVCTQLNPFLVFKFVYGLNEAILNELWFYLLLRNCVLPIPYGFYDDLNKDVEMQMWLLDLKIFEFFF